MKDQSPQSAAPGARAARPRKRLTVFRGADAVDVQSHMPVLGVDESVTSGLKLLAEANPSADPSNGARTVLLFREAGDEGVSLAYIWFKSGYVLPRHSHDSDCLYFVMAGELKLGSRVLKKGDGMFIPAHAGYTYQAGPQGVEVLEFRNATNFSFLFRNNDQAHWQRIANVLREGADRWEGEKPPSEVVDVVD